MKAPSVGKIKRLAKSSLVLGILSFGFSIILPLAFIFIVVFYTIVVIASQQNDITANEFVSNLCAASVLGSLILGVAGCFASLIALKRIGQEGEDTKVKRIAIFGLIFNGLGILILLLFVIVAYHFFSNR